MKVVISLKPLQSESKTRGIGVYTKNLIAHLQQLYPQDEFIPTTHDYYHQDADLIHFPFFDPFFLTLPFRKTQKTIVTIHDLIPLKYPHHFPKGIRGTLKWYLQHLSLRNVTHLITDSQASKKDIVDILHFSPQKITVIPLAPSIDYQKIPRQLLTTVSQQYHLPDKFLLYVGDINWNKNVPGLINAFGRLTDDSLHLVLVGKSFTQQSLIPELQDILKAIETNPHKKRIHRLGFVPSHHLPVFYSLSFAYIQPSWDEGFGLPPLEAMQYGCPVIVSNQGSLPEVVADAGLLFDPHQPDSLVKALNRLLKSPSLVTKLARQGQQRAKLFSWQQTARLTYAVYRQLVANQ